jgi:glycosyltransferase involved in cell wall biosynthesis
VFLDMSHQESFGNIYRNKTNNFSISNLAFLELGFASRPRAAPVGRALRLGFLANIQLTKGVDTFVRTIGQLREAGQEIEARIAGPFQDQAAKDVVRSAAAAGLVHYVGPVFGSDKQRFLDDIDVLLFPSRYANETEPLVVLECMAAGAPVLATPVGCLPRILGTDNPLLILAEDFASQALALITQFRDDPASYESASALALSQVSDRRSGAQAERDAFFRSVTAPWGRR